MSEEGSEATCGGGPAPSSAPVRGGMALLKAARVPSDRALLVPSSEDLALVVASANTVEHLVEVSNMLAAMLKAAEQLEVAVTDAIRLAAAHLRARRKLGLLMLQLGHQGRIRTESQRANLCGGALSDIVDKDQASRCRKLARVPEDAFESYLATAEAQHTIPREAAVIRLLRKPPTSSHRPRGSRRGQKDELSLNAAVVDAVVRCLGEIDVLVGKASTRSTEQIVPSAAVPKGLRGAVLVAECGDPEEWLPTLLRLRTKGTVDDVVVVLPADPSAKWFRHMADGWCCCFLRGERPILLAHRGLHARSFDLVMREHGVVLRAAAS